jgi:RimJ/RimL family protein N-acetyltransferase
MAVLLDANGRTVTAMETDHAAAPRTELELLALQAEMALDDRGQLAATWGVMLAVTDAGRLLFVGSDVPDTLIPALLDAVATSPPGAAADSEPPAIDACRAILTPLNTPLLLEAGPCYVIEPHVGFATPIAIVCSDSAGSAPLLHLNPGNWEEDEWAELLDGALGPWAMAVVEEQVVSICHTPQRMTARAAECGVWTHPDFRGHGYAAAVTAAWAAILQPSGRYLFYSTDASNRSSQRVAARLRLRPIGWRWSLARADREQSSQRHPLSRRSSGRRAE